MKKKLHLLGFYLLLLIASASCSDETDTIVDDSSTENQDNETQSTLSVVDKTFEISVNENKENGEVLEKIAATSTSGDITFVVKSSSPSGAIEVTSDGTIQVGNATLFDFEVNSTLTAVITVSNDDDTLEVNITVNLIDVDESNTTPTLAKNTIISTDSDVFNLTATKIAVDKTSSFSSAEGALENVFWVKLIDDNNHGPMILWLPSLPIASTTFYQSQTQTSDLLENEFYIEYVRTPENKYAYGYVDQYTFVDGEKTPVSIPKHEMDIVLENGVITFNLHEIELLNSSVFGGNGQNFNISFSVNQSDLKLYLDNDLNVSRSYDLVD